MIYTKSAIIFVVICAVLWSPVESKAVFGIGMRIIGDQLLMRDVQLSPPTGLAEHPTVGFSYAIPNPITYIEILSEENVLAEVNFSYENDLVKGTVMAIASSTTDVTNEIVANDAVNTSSPQTNNLRAKAPASFEVLITIYGFNDTMLNVNPAYILNRDQQFEGRLEPQQGDEEEFDPQLNDEGFVEGDDDDNNDNGDDDDDDDEDYGDDVEERSMEPNAGVHFDTDERDVVADEYDTDMDFEHADKIIEVGHRQPGDSLIYETHQTSPSLTQLPTNHSVVFYYVDSEFITYVKFVIFDHYVGKTSMDYVPPMAEYTHFSPHTLKAVVTDHETTSLFVRMMIYGYSKAERPVDYVPFLTQSPQHDGFLEMTEAPMSPLRRLKMLIKADQFGNTDTEQQQQNNAMAAEQKTATGSSTDNPKCATANGVQDLAPCHCILGLITVLYFTVERFGNFAL